MTTLALCMIAKDEERFLDGCLDSVKGLVDQLILVDTGSADRTIEIAQAHGAHVVAFPWIGDFAAARNAALPHCKTDWILMLDADERLLKAGHEHIRCAIASDQADGYMLPLYNARSLDTPPELVLQSEHNHGSTVTLLRLTRRTPDFAWDGLIHEGPHRWAGQHAHRIAGLNAPIIHYGYVPELRLGRKKAERNTLLLERRCEIEPDAPAPWAYLASEYRFLGRKDDAFACAERSWTNVLKALAGPPPHPSAIQPGAFRVMTLFDRGMVEEAMQVLDQLQSWNVLHPNLTHLRALGEEALGVRSTSPRARAHHLARALKAFGECLRFGDQTLTQEKMADITGWVGLHRLNQCLLLAGAVTAAVEGFEEAICAYPNEVKLQEGLTEALIRAGHFERASHALSHLLTQDRPDPWVLAAALFDEMGDLDAMRNVLHRARQLAPGGFRNERYEALLRFLEDAQACYRQIPHAFTTPVGILAHLARRASLPASVDRGTPHDPLPTAAFLKNWARQRRLHDLRALVEPRAEALLPGLVALVQKTLREHDLPTLDASADPLILLGANATRIESLTLHLMRHPAFREGRRPLFAVPDSNADLRSLAQQVPNSRFIHVPSETRDAYTASCLAEWRQIGKTLTHRFIELNADALSRTPHEALRTAMAFAGEPWDDAVLHGAPWTHAPDVVQARLDDALWQGSLSLRRSRNPNGATT